VSHDDEQGLAGLPGTLSRLGGRRVLVVTGPSRRYSERVQAELDRAGGGFEVEVFAGARRHVPEPVLAEARAHLDAFRADTVVALGGGSAIGVGKALRRERDFRFVAIPTTYAGSEMTSLWGTTRDGAKTTGRDAKVRPDAIVYDVELTVDMPRTLTVTSLMNALAHPLSVLGAPPPAGAPAGAPFGSLAGEARAAALEAVVTVYGAIEALVRAPTDRRARLRALRGAGLAAQALEAGKPGLHHSLAHRLGGRFDLDHSGLHSVLLPHSLRRLRDEAPVVVDELARLLGVADLEGSLFDFLLRAQAATSLRALGVTLQGLVTLLDETPELPGPLLRAAFHGRRPSAATRNEDWGLRELVSVRGPALATARRVVVAIHGRGATADGILGRAVEIAGNDPTVSVVAPQASDNVWYAGRNHQPRAELGAALEASLGQLDTVLERVIVQCGGPERVVLFGFSQGACLAIELFVRRSAALAGLVALSGAGIGLPDEQPPAGPGVAGVPVLLGASESDSWVPPAQIEAAARRLAGAGADVTIEFVAGDSHALHGRHRLLAGALLRAQAATPPPAGFCNFHESETLPGALPVDQNSPRSSPYGLYAEQLNATGFVAPREANRRSWMYRIRPSAEQGPLAPLAHERLRGDFSGEPVEANLAGWGPLPFPASPTDFVDGLATLGGAGSPSSRRGYAVHLYAANRGMEDRCFSDADGDLLLLPEEGSLTLLTELGVLQVHPGQLALVPRGVRFSVLLGGSRARGYVGESFGRPFSLPERGPVGANGLADARHFRGPVARHEERLCPGYRVTVKLGGALFEATQDHSPFDVVAWHGNHFPTVYDLAAFSPAGNARVDHIDPSIHTVLTSPLDEAGANGLDLVVFTPRWDATEHTFRPPYFHRNVATELNGIIREVASAGSPFARGCCFLTPSFTPHGVLATGVERTLALDDERADQARRSADSSLWFQFESTLPFSPTAWARTAPNRVDDWPLVWGAYRRHFRG
jgi:homogentisate 1,2-dioxygenase